MKKHLLLTVLLTLCLLLSFSACTGNVDPETEPSTDPTVAQPTTEATTAPPEPADIYLAAAQALETGAVGMKIHAAHTLTVGGQTFTRETDQTVNYWNLGTDDLIVQVDDSTDYGEYEYAVSELYGNGNVYQTLNGCLFTASMDRETFTARYPAPRFLDPALYTVTWNEAEGTLSFTDATAPESWLAGEDATLNTADATVTLGYNGAITGCTYSADYSYGPGQIAVSYTVTYTDPGEAPALPESAADYLVLTDIDGMWLQEHAYGYLTQAKQYTSSILSSVQSQAAGLMMNTQYSMDTYALDQQTDYRLKTSVFAMDQSGEYETELDEKFIGGKYSMSTDGGEDAENPAVTAGMMENYAFGLLSENFFEVSMFTDAEITDLGSLLLVEYTCAEDMALSVCETINTTLFGQPDTLEKASTAYRTNEIEYYLALDKYTLLPTAAGFTYEGCHTIDGYECLLIQQTDQAFELASLTSHEAIYEEPSADIEPENKPTPLFYHVTGDNGQEMWLFGTIHVGDDRTAFLPGEITDALLGSDALAVECDTEGFDEAVEADDALQDQVSALYFYSDGTVADHLVTEDLYEDAVKAMKATGNYFFNSDYQKASLWSNAIENYYLRQGHSLVSEKGVESRLEKIAEENQIPLWEVESSLFQIEMMTGYSDELQEYMLYGSAYTHGKEYWESVAELYALWCAGDEAALTEEMARESWELTEEDFEETEDMTEEDRQKMEAILADLDNINPQLETIRQEYLKAMEIDRNAGMLEVAKGYLESGDTVFFAVGLAHLLAEDGLVTTLREAGYTVELVPYA